MALFIQTTGLEDYAPGGKARVKVLVIGGPAAGKTRWSSYFPKPFYADCEGGLASVADRKVPYVRVNSSQDMLDVLAYIRQENRQPVANRKYETFVVDTLDAYQRKVKNEWCEKERKETFTGWEAWGYLNSRMQALMTRLLNLDMNVVVLAHYKDKTTKDDDTGKETHTLSLQVQGELGDTAYNDFDLVAWMGTYWEAANGERVQKRGLTFKATPDKPFLKDRLHVTPPWLEVEFADSDYSNLFNAIQSRVEQIAPGEVVGEVPTDQAPAPSAFVIAPGQAGSGPLPATPPKDIPFAQMDKVTLGKLARDRGITTTVDGVPLKGNTLKAEFIAALEAHANAPSPAPAAEAATTPDKPTESPASTPVVVEAGTSVAPEAPAKALRTMRTEAGTVNVVTGEILDPVESAISTVEKVLGGTVVAQDAPPPPPPLTPPPSGAAVPVDEVCATCEKPLSGENADFVKLAWIKYRKKLCAEHYAERKNASR